VGGGGKILPRMIYAWITLRRRARHCAPLWSVVLLALLTGLACDDKNESPEALKARQQAQQSSLPATKPLPTTQELLTGPKKTLRLGEFPLSLEVPHSWGLRSFGDGAASVIAVSGVAGSGEINIQLVQQNQTINSALGVESILAEAKKQLAAKPHPLNRAEMRPLGPAKLLEMRGMSNQFVNGKLPAEVWGDVEIPDSRGNVVTTRAIINPHLLTWTFTLYIPTQNGRYMTRSLVFMGLTPAEYEKDKEFLEGMMKTLKWEE
jgi:hypothetical protein